MWPPRSFPKLASGNSGQFIKNADLTALYKLDPVSIKSIAKRGPLKFRSFVKFFAKCCLH